MAASLSKNLSVKARINVLIGIAFFALLVVGAVAYTGLKFMEAEWNTYQTTIKTRADYVATLRSQFGYGGGIHNFKNFVLRNTTKHFNRYNQNADEVLAVVSKYRSLGNLTNTETRSLTKLEELAEKYRSALNTAKQMYDAGSDPKAVDGAIKIDDSPYIDALNALQNEINKMTAEEASVFENELIADRNLLLIIISGTMVVMMILGYLLGRAITGPLDRAVRVANGISGGDLTVDIPTGSNDEIGQLMFAMKAMNENLRNITQTVQHNAATISAGSEQIAAGNTSLSQRTEEQASSLEETASSMEEMTGTVKQNADSAAQAKQLADANRTRATSGAEVVTRAVEAMGEINESSARIAEIITTIDGIAFQTNLLALNAAVEAARAGEQGRGFAVVAAEVRSLAQRSADAAKEIKALIEDSVGKVRSGTALVDESGKTLEEIIEGTRKVSDIVAEIAAASMEQASGIDQVNNAITQMDNMTQDNAALVEEAAAASRSMLDQSRELNNLMSFFKLSNDPAIDNKTTSPEQPTLVSTEPARSNNTHLEHLKQAKAKPSKDDTSEWEQF